LAEITVANWGELIKRNVDAGDVSIISLWQELFCSDGTLTIPLNAS
jgi:hypothetical protein